MTNTGGRKKRFRYKLPKFRKIDENKRLFRRFVFHLLPLIRRQTLNSNGRLCTNRQPYNAVKRGCFVKLCSLESHVTTFSVPSVTDTSLKFQFFIATLNERGHSAQKPRHSRRPTWSQHRLHGTLSWNTPPVLKVPVAAKPSAGIPYIILTIN